MLEYPLKLKSLFIYENESVGVVGSLEDHFFARTTDIMRDFLKVCEGLREEELQSYLVKKYSPNIIKAFMKKLKDYDNYFFAKDNKESAKFDFNRKITVLTLNISRSCNMKCGYCVNEIEFLKAPGMMDKATALKAVEFFLGQLGEESGKIIFTGGEPLLNFDVLKEVTEYINKTDLRKRISFVLKTNGTLLSEDIIDFVVGNDFEVRISIDGDKAVHDCHRVFEDGSGSFDSVINPVFDIIDKGYGHRVILEAVVTHDTVKYIRESHNFLKNIKNINSFRIRPAAVKEESSYRLSEDDETAYAKYLNSLAREVYASGSGNYSNNIEAVNICGIGVWNVSVDIDGSIYPCYRLSGLDGFKMGSIADKRYSLSIPEELYNIYETMFSNACNGCYSNIFCRNGCFTAKLLNAHQGKCSNFEKKFSDYMLVENLVNSGAYNLLPVI